MAEKPQQVETHQRPVVPPLVLPFPALLENGAGFGVAEKISSRHVKPLSLRFEDFSTSEDEELGFLRQQLTHEAKPPGVQRECASPPSTSGAHEEPTESIAIDIVSPSRTASPRELRGFERGLAYTVLLLILGGITASSSLLAPILPLEADARGISPIWVGLIFTAFCIGNGLASTLHCKLLQKQRMFQRTLLACGIAVASLTSAGFGALFLLPSNHASLFILPAVALRFLHGIGAAAVEVAAFGIVTQFYYGASDFGSADTFMESAVATGWMAGPAISGVLAAFFGPCMPLFVFSAFAAIMLPTVLLLPEEMHGSMYPILHKPTQAGILGMLKNPEILLLLLIAAIGAGAVSGLDATLGPYLKAAQGFGPLLTGLCFTLLAAFFALSAWPAGWLAVCINPLKLIVGGLLLLSVPFVILGLAFGASWLIWASLAILGATAALCLTPALPATLFAAEKAVEFPTRRMKESLSSLSSKFYSFGAGIGPFASGAWTATFGFEKGSVIFGVGLLTLATALVIASAVASRQQKAPYDATETDDASTDCSDDEEYYSIV